MKKEIRSFVNAGLLEARASKDGSKKLAGYALVFNSASQDLGGFIEILAPGCLTRTLRENPDVLHLRDHDSAKLLGRTTAGTMTLTVDSKGLRFVTTLPDTEIAADTYENVRLRNLTGNSFGFQCVSDKWENIDGQIVRTVLDLNLSEISTTSFPAYQKTSVDVRSIQSKLTRRENTGIAEDDMAERDDDVLGTAMCSDADCDVCSASCPDCTRCGIRCMAHRSVGTNVSEDDLMLSGRTSRQAKLLALIARR